MGLLLASVALAPVATAAPAGENAPQAVYRYEVSVVDKSVSRGVTNYGKVLATCGTPSRTVACEISETRSTTRSIGVSAGTSRAFVAGKLGISSARTVSLRISCERKTTTTYPYLNAYVVNDVWSYTVRTKKYDYNTGKLVQTINSKQRAYDPKGVRCALSSVAG
ncbi:hypothetical protein [Promicromonospora sp. NPDC050880]|uniref:hypothetical protein n=1 Tax=Promicromonospora sp. NPDC050880 TaxID=3364406 RepID=UPI003796CC63